MSFQSATRQDFLGRDTNVINALLLDDNEFDRKRIRRMNDRLDRPLLLEEAPTIEAMANRMDHTSFDLIMIDYGLGQDDGLTALDIVREHKLHKNAATIMISGTAQTSVAVSAMKRGFDDYVSKHDLTPDTLQRSVSDALGPSQVYGYCPDRDMRTGHSHLANVLSTALQDPNVQDVLLQSFGDAMRQAAYEVGLAHGLREARDIQVLMSSLDETDEFKFR